MPDQRDFDDIPLIAEFGATLRSAMVAAEAAEAAAAPSPVEQTKKRPWWKSFRLFGTVLVLGLVGTGATAATLTILRGSPIPAPKSIDLGAAMTARASTQHVLALRAADPSGTLPAFALRTGTSLGGQTCVTVGEVDRGTFGLVGTDRTFRAVPSTFVDGCGTATGRDVAVAGARVLDAASYDDVRSVVYAVGGPSLRSARLLVRGEWRTLPVRQGATIAAVKGYPEDSGLSLVLTMAGGRRVTHDLGRSPTTFTDPDGPAWAAQNLGRAGAGGSCIRLTRARAAVVTDPAVMPDVGPQTPMLCDPPLSRDRNSLRSAQPLDPSYFTTKTLRPGDAGGKAADLSTWSWHGAPARTIVWGYADQARVRRVQVTAPGQRATTYATTAYGTFAVIYPASVPAAAVRVTLTMRDGSVRRLGEAGGDHRNLLP